MAQAVTADIDSILAAVNGRMMSRGEHLFPFQEDGARWLAPQRVALLADAPGIGKTNQCVAAAPPRAPILVVCPASVKWSWAKTFRFLRPEFVVKIVESRAEWRVPKPGQVVICNYEVLPPAERELDEALREVADAVAVPCPAIPMGYEMREKFTRSLIAAGGPKSAPGLWRKMTRIVQARRVLQVPHAGTVLIEDEAHRGKNADAAVTGRLRQLRDVLRSAPQFRIWLVTGTPMENNLGEAWEVMENAFLGAIIFKPSDGSTQARGQFDMDALFPGRVPEKLKASGLFLRRERDDVLPDLPAKTVEEIPVDLDPDTMKLADSIVDGLAVAGVNIHTATLEAIETATLTKIPREIMAQLRMRIAAAKVPVMLDLVGDLEDAGVPVAVFSDHVAALRLLATRKGWWKITGDESDEERQAAIEAIGKPDGRGIALSIRAAGTGTDGIQKRVWRGIFIDWPWNPQKLEQARDRLCVQVGQRVHTRRGFVPIEEVIQGDAVLTGGGAWQRVSATHRRGHRQLFTRIAYARYHEPLSTTHDHHVLVRRNGTTFNQWTKAHEVLPGDFLCAPRPREDDDISAVTFPELLRNPFKTSGRPRTTLTEASAADVRRRRRAGESPKSIAVVHGVSRAVVYAVARGSRWKTPKPYRSGHRMPDRIELARDVLYLLGWYAAEGCSVTAKGKGSFVSLSAHEKERPILERLGRVFARWGVKWTIYTKRGSRGIELRAFSRECASWFGLMFGKGAHEKRFPSWVMDLPKLKAKVVVEAYIDGDGHRRKRQSSWNSVSATLASQSCLLAMKCGLSTSLNFVAGSGQFSGGYTRGGDYRCNRRHELADEQFVYHQVTSVTTEHGRADVVDLTVPGHESFVVGFATVHNCRIGQKSNKALYTDLVANHVLERRIAELLKLKTKTFHDNITAAATPGRRA